MALTYFWRRLLEYVLSITVLTSEMIFWPLAVCCSNFVFTAVFDMHSSNRLSKLAKSKSLLWKPSSRLPAEKENHVYVLIYEGCSKWIAYFYLETSNFKLAQKYSFHALEVLPVARNAKFQPMYPLLEGVTVRWFGHSNKVLMNGKSKCLSGLVFPPSKECFQFRKQKEITWGKVWGIRGSEAKQLLFLSSKMP